MFDRRKVVLGLGLSCVTHSFARAQPKSNPAAPSQNNPSEARAIEDEIKSWIHDPNHADYFKQQADQGTDRGSLQLAPSDERVKWAASYLAALPTDLTPIDIAKYMIRTVPSQYIMEWPADTPTARLPANPLIVAFFSATKTDPAQGDETAWCAAFVCWTLRHCGAPYPNAAGSRSFRNYAPLPATTSPEIGDLVVFQNQSSPDQGHVAYFDGFVDADKTKVWCVGGNQGNRLSRKPLFVSKGDLRVVSYRSGEALRRRG
jgi:uncharacterized protein (TIGR02594 family)